MTAERWTQIETLFHSALAVPADRRGALLAQACSSDDELRSEVERLLAAADEDDAFLESPPSAVALRRTPLDAGIEGRRLGAFSVRRRIGAGAVGAVYEATHQPTGRRVALKVVRGAAVTEAALRRFEHEAALLSRLRHPAVAEVFEAGIFDTDDGGIPYLAMECVESAETIVEHVRRRRLPWPETLRLVGVVCDAVHHGHLRGVIHRDLKPGNILVGGGDGRVKVIDFGVARLTAADRTLTTMHTGTGQIVGTLPYMSPEQCRDPQEIDTRSDVYSLGVVLYECLCGRPPHDMRCKPLLDALHTIQEAPPPKPSSLCPGLPADVDTILLKCLDKDRARRYQSAAELAADLDLCVDRKPIRARPSSWPRRVRTFSRRHRTAVTAASVVFLVLLGASAASAVFAWSAVRAARSEARMRVDAERVAHFLQDMLAAADPERGESAAGLRDVLLQAAGRVSRDFGGMPAVEASLRRSIGNTFSALGLFDEAEQQLRQSLVLATGRPDLPIHEQTAGRLSLARVLVARARFAEADPLLRELIAELRGRPGDSRAMLVTSLTKLGESLTTQGQLDEAEALFNEALAAAEELGDEALIARGLGQVGNLRYMKGRFAEAEATLRGALDRVRAYAGDDSLDVAEQAHNLACVLIERGRYDEAEPLVRRCLDIRRARQPADHRDVAVALQTLSNVLHHRNDFHAAEQTLAEAVEIRRRRLGADHPELAQGLNDLGFLRKELGRYADAEVAYREALAIQHKAFAGDHTDLAHTFINLATVTKLRGDLEAAEPLAREALRMRRAVLGEDHPHSIMAMNVLGELLNQRRYESEARPLLEQALAKSRRIMGDGHWLTAACRSNLAYIDRRQGRPELAEAALRDVLAMAEKQFGGGNLRTAQCRYNLAVALHDQGRLAEAEALMRTAVADCSGRIEADHPMLAVPRMRFGALLTDLGKTDEAEAALRAALATLERTRVPDYVETANARAYLGQCLLRAGKAADAEPLLAAALPRLRDQLGADDARTREVAAALAKTRSRTAEKPLATPPNWLARRAR